MANTAQARKRARQATEQRAHNMGLRSKLRTAIKNVRKAVATGDKTAAADLFKQSQKVIDSVADKNIVHKNAAARYKSRLSAAIKAL
jgi:small subunit ribosomal protein S20